MNIEHGVISNWNEEKGFGFITPGSGGKPIFFHINDYSYRHKRPIINLEVEYFSSTDQKGRKCAIDVAPIKRHTNNSRELMQKVYSLGLFSTFSCLLYYLFQSKVISVEIVGLYAFMTVMAFIMYARDKNAAKYGRWRTSESTLHIFSLLGGWPGAKIAQSFLRHKSQKVSFRITYWVTVVLNCGALYWLVTQKYEIWLKSLISTVHKNPGNIVELIGPF